MRGGKGICLEGGVGREKGKSLFVQRKEERLEKAKKEKRDKRVI